jgi:hypothetical protein
MSCRARRTPSPCTSARATTSNCQDGSSTEPRTTATSRRTSTRLAVTGKCHFYLDSKFHWKPPVDTRDEHRERIMVESCREARPGHTAGFSTATALAPLASAPSSPRLRTALVPSRQNSLEERSGTDSWGGGGRKRLVVSRSTCPPLSTPPHANSFIIGTAVINTHTQTSATSSGRRKVTVAKKAMCRWPLGTIERRCGVTVLVKPLTRKFVWPGFRK